MRTNDDNSKPCDEPAKDQQTPAKRVEVVGRSVGECRNILPVLVEHLRSALELRTSASRTDEPLAPDPSSSSSNACADEDDTTKSSLRTTMDLNFFEDLLLSDIKTALVRLQDTLRRVDVDALSRYSSSLEPNDKLHLLQLISNLVSNLKMAKLEDLPQQIPQPPIPAKRRQHTRGRDRHTIGVSSEELARARKWLEERGPVSAPIASQVRTTVATIMPQLGNSSPPATDTREKVFDSPRACDKHMKDAINQQQSLQSRTKDVEATTMVNIHDPKGSIDGGRYVESLDTTIDTPIFLNRSSNNKFIAKKTKLKRANTIDIPNYLKLQAEKNGQASSPGLRRPIDISDRLSWTQPQLTNVAIPSFEPKTDNDRKFLALINRNNDSNGSTPCSSSPFKSFNYRQTSSMADKNWKSRFSNIKTTFDKPSPPASVDGSSRRSSRDDTKPVRIEKDTASGIVASLRHVRSAESSPHNNITRKFPSFTHAASSPFQKIRSSHKNIVYQEPEKPLTTCYLPACASSGMLRAKLKMFDQELPEPPPRPTPPERPRMNINKPERVTSLNHCQQTKTHTNNGFHRLTSYDKARRNSMYDDNVQLKSHEIDPQRRQSVAVQTTNYPIQLNQRLENQHDSLLIAPPPPPIPQPRPRPPPRHYQPQMPKIFYEENENPIYVPPRPLPRDLDFLVDATLAERGDKKYWNRDSYDGDTYNDDDTSEDHSFLDDENIQNQDISEDKIVTRYACAIGTVETSPSRSPATPPPTFEPIVPSYPEPVVPICPANAPVPIRDDVARHNMLQQSLIRRLQCPYDEPVKPQRVVQPTQRYSMLRYDTENTPMFLPSVEPTNGRESIEPLIDSNNTKDKISLFEEKSTRRIHDRPEPLMLPCRPPYVPPLPKINVVSPSRTLPQGYAGPPTIPPLTVKYPTGPGDSSDEYLVSCASRPHRNIVLSKSESWHQLAMAKSHLQVPQHAPAPHKPPRVSSAITRHVDTTTDALKKMEEKVQRYFHGSSLQVHHNKKETKGTKRSFSPRKNSGLARSHTMPHIYDETTDVDKAFDSLFEETTRDINRH